MNENTKTIRDLAAYVCDRLVGKVLIHRYDAYSTNSVYLKFDYGVANSLRIADHAGKEYLSYRFNIILTLAEPKNDLSGRFPRNYYPPDMVDQVIEDILAGVEAKRARYRDYEKTVTDATERRGEKPEGVAVELADAVIRIADLCGHLGIDLEAAIDLKMAYNETRPFKHGKRF